MRHLDDISGDPSIVVSDSMAHQLLAQTGEFFVNVYQDEDRTAYGRIFGLSRAYMRRLSTDYDLRPAYRIRVRKAA